MQHRGTLAPRIGTEIREFGVARCGKRLLPRCAHEALFEVLEAPGVVRRRHVTNIAQRPAFGESQFDPAAERGDTCD